MLLGWKNQYGENDCIFKNNLEIESNIKLSVTFFTEIEKKLKLTWNQNKTLNR